MKQASSSESGAISLKVPIQVVKISKYSFLGTLSCLGGQQLTFGRAIAVVGLVGPQQ